MARIGYGTRDEVVARLVGRRIIAIEGGFWDPEHLDFHQPRLRLDSGEYIELGDETLQIKNEGGLDVEWGSPRELKS